MSYEIYTEQRDELERGIAFYQRFLTDEAKATRPEGYAATLEMVASRKARLNELNMSYYGTAALYR